MVKIGAIIQTRMNSHRFYGKALYQVAGKPLLQYLLERIKQCRLLNTMVVATSVEESDSLIVDFCHSYGVSCYQGSLLDVAGRFKDVLDQNQWDAFVRVNGDSPLIDAGLIDHGIEVFLKGNLDIVTNVMPRTYPRGQSVEVMMSDVFKKAYLLMRDPESLEHVSKYFYDHREDFRIYNFSSVRDYSHIQLSVDDTKDMERFVNLIKVLKKPHWEYRWRELVNLLERARL